MARLPIRRPSRPRTTSLIAILVCTAVLASILAWDAWRSQTSHRETAERTLRDYASFAAWEFAAGSKEVLYNYLIWAFEPLAAQKPLPPGKALPSPSILDSKEIEQLRCEADSMQFSFRLDLRDGSLVTSGPPAAPSMVGWIADTVAKHAKTEYTKDWSYAAVFGTTPKAQRALVYQVKWSADRQPVAAYGFPLCLDRFGAPLFSMLVKKYPLLPPALTKGTHNDSLLSVTVADEMGRELWASSQRYESHYAGEHKIASFGSLSATVTLRPDLAESLVIGGLPRSHIPLLFGVLGITIVLSGIGVAQLRREGELARLRANFVAGVSHELRTPLAQVRMFAETLLLGRVRSEDERQRSLQIIDQEARRLTHLVENILQFSRAERQAVTLNPEPVPVAPQVREVLEGFAPLARARQVTLASELVEGVEAMADAGALRQILLNLLDNAVKYGPAGQTVTVRVRAAGECVRLEVDDQGPGVPPANRRRVWESYYRLERDAGSAVAGSGIGLSVVMELVLLQHGRAWIDEAPGGGARIVVELPNAGAPAAAPRALPDAARMEEVRT
jgi:signal transduction histidine kinase